ncbi:MAG: sulfatase-like hydrolase/transferase [Bdellovibrionales bacterium]
MAVGVKHLNFILSVSLGLGLVGCGWQGRGGPNTLVIAVENLAFERASCESDDMAGREFESFRLFCEDGVRFTHAYTTSTLSQAALGSLLTGFYPLEHGLRNNGRDFLSARFETVAEAAVGQGYRTALISGGPPILRKSGVSQGFEVFDDNFPVPPKGLYRPAQEVTKIFLNWLDRGVDRDTFFSVLYLADLQFPEAATVSDLGEVRERSQESQVREVAESLTTLIKEMRERGLWHRTHVVLLGLSGGSGGRPSEIAPMNLYSENTQVALFLKPARRTRDQGPQWTIDKNISLADVGKSLYEFVGAIAPEPPLKQLPRVSLFPLIDQPQADWSDDRVILTESGWGSWRWLSPTRFAARRRQYLYVHDVNAKMYNTLLDRLEQNPLPASDPLWTTLNEGVLSLFHQLEIMPWRVHDQVMWQKNLAAQKWWSQKSSMQTMLPEGFHLTDGQVRRWLVSRMVQRNDWASLQKFGDEQKESIYSYVGRRNQGQGARLPGGRCGRLFDKALLNKRISDATRTELSCGDEMFESLVDVVGSKEKERRERAMEAFMRRLNVNRWESEVGAANYARWLPWDVSTTLPEGVTLSELFLALPEHKNLSGEIKGRRLRENRALDL